MKRLNYFFLVSTAFSANLQNFIDTNYPFKSLNFNSSRSFLVEFETVNATCHLFDTKQNKDLSAKTSGAFAKISLAKQNLLDAVDSGFLKNLDLVLSADTVVTNPTISANQDDKSMFSPFSDKEVKEYSSNLGEAIENFKTFVNSSEQKKISTINFNVGLRKKIFKFLGFRRLSLFAGLGFCLPVTNLPETTQIDFKKLKDLDIWKKSFNSYFSAYQAGIELALRKNLVVGIDALYKPEEPKEITKLIKIDESSWTNSFNLTKENFLTRPSSYLLKPYINIKWLNVAYVFMQGNSIKQNKLTPDWSLSGVEYTLSYNLDLDDSVADDEAKFFIRGFRPVGFQKILPFSSLSVGASLNF